MDDLEKALGQFALYRAILDKLDMERQLWIAMPFDVAILFDEPLGQLLLESDLIRAISFDPVEEVIVRWIP